MDGKAKVQGRGKGSGRCFPSPLQLFLFLDTDDCFYYHSWRNNVVIAFGTLSSFLTYLHILGGVVSLFVLLQVMKN